MASSGVYTFSYTRDQIINAALRKLSVLSEGQTANADQITTGAEALNLLVLELTTLGMPLWARKKVVTTMVTAQSSYTISLIKPLKIYQAYREVVAEGIHIDMEVLADYDFNLLPSDSTGIPVNCTFQPLVGSGVLQVWPTPDSTVPANTTVTLVYQAPFEVFVASTDTPDFPQEWYNAVVYQLALLLAPEYGIPIQDTSSLEKQAEKHLNTVLGFGQEDASVYFTVRKDY